METPVRAYAEWSLACHRARVAPRIRALGARFSDLVDARRWLDTVGPGPDVGSATRLYPGSLFLLWLDALGVDVADAEAAPVAAAIELMHNASLLHDDILDGHVVRRGQPTVLGIAGTAGALLGGDALVALATGLLIDGPPSLLPVTLREASDALAALCEGQWLDEPTTWDQVRPPDRRAHWERVCEGKLAVGNLPGRMAARWAGDDALLSAIDGIQRAFAPVSQILNDLGDLLDFAGFHTLGPSGRRHAEESARKPTYATLVARPGSRRDDIDHDEALLAARREIGRRRDEAIAGFDALALREEPARVLRTFFSVPEVPSAGLQLREPSP